jgi:CDP-4-dehydro-6-deoxyglucose reductase
VTLSNGRIFEVGSDSTILDAAAAQGIVLEHSCRTGRCGSCKARVVRGQVTQLHDASSLSLEEARAGWVLTCAHAAASELTLDVEDLSSMAGIVARTLPARVAALDLLAPDVLRVALRLPPAPGFRFLPGQSIDVSSPGGIKRSYSLASDASSEGPLELQVRRVESGCFSAYWFGQARVNDLLRFRGPLGTFYLRESVGLHVVFLATGTGMAPFRSMLLQISALPHAQKPASVSLYWGGRLPADLYFDPRPLLNDLTYVPVLSRADEAWDGARGHVQDVCLRKHPHPLRDTVLYACGNAAMIDSAKQGLISAGLPRNRFHFDAFVSSD